MLVLKSGAATGWPATDWMEEFMLRTTTTENYDKWVAGTLPFASPEVMNAATKLGELWFNEDYVYGGRAAITTTFFGDAPLPMFEILPSAGYTNRVTSSHPSSPPVPLPVKIMTSSIFPVSILPMVPRSSWLAISWPLSLIVPKSML